VDDAVNMLLMESYFGKISVFAVRWPMLLQPGCMLQSNAYYPIVFRSFKTVSSKYNQIKVLVLDFIGYCTT